MTSLEGAYFQVSKRVQFQQETLVSIDYVMWGFCFGNKLKVDDTVNYKK